ncbi:MAG: hypothetical protein WBG96_07700, partial [Thermoanaerobaculia bacterium]
AFGPRAGTAREACPGVHGADPETALSASGKASARAPTGSPSRCQARQEAACSGEDWKRVAHQ